MAGLGEALQTLGAGMRQSTALDRLREAIERKRQEEANKYWAGLQQPGLRKLGETYPVTELSKLGEFAGREIPTQGVDPEAARLQTVEKYGFEPSAYKEPGTDKMLLEMLKQQNKMEQLEFTEGGKGARQGLYHDLMRELSGKELGFKKDKLLADIRLRKQSMADAMLRYKGTQLDDRLRKVLDNQADSLAKKMSEEYDIINNLYKSKTEKDEARERINTLDLQLNDIYDKQNQLMMKLMNIEVGGGGAGSGGSVEGTTTSGPSADPNQVANDLWIQWELQKPKEKRFK